MAKGYFVYLEKYLSILNFYLGCGIDVTQLGNPFFLIITERNNEIAHILCGVPTPGIFSKWTFSEWNKQIAGVFFFACPFRFAKVLWLQTPHGTQYTHVWRGDSPHITLKL